MDSTTKTDQLRMLEQGMARVQTQVEYLQSITTQIRQDVSAVLRVLNESLVADAARGARWEALWCENERIHQETKEAIEELEKLARTNEHNIEFLRAALNRIQDKIA